MLCNFNREAQIKKLIRDAVKSLEKLRSFDNLISWLYERKIIGKTNYPFEAEVILVAAETYSLYNASVPELYKISDNIDLIYQFAEQYEDDIDSFIKNVRSLYNKKSKAPQQELEDIVIDITNKIDNNKPVLLKQIDQFIEVLNKTVDSVEYNPATMLEDRQIFFDKYKSRLIDVLAKKHIYSSEVTLLRNSKVPEISEGDAVYTKYKDLKEILETNGVIIANLNDGRVQLAINKNSGVQLFNEDGSVGEFFSNTEVASKIPISRLFPKDSGYLKFPLSDSLIYSGIDFITEGLDDQSKTILSTFSSNPDAMRDAVTITAHKNLNQEGVIRHLSTLEGLPEIDRLSLESLQQSKQLSFKESNVVSASLPTNNDYFYKLTIKETGNSIIIRTLDDLVLVDSNNSVSKFFPEDTSNIVLTNEQLPYFSKSTSVKEPDGVVTKRKETLEPSDAVNIARGFKNLNAFKERVKLRSQLVGSGNTIDVTADFIDAFNLSVRPLTERVPLPRYNSLKLSSTFEFDVVTIDRTGTITNRYKKRIPLLYTKVPGSKNFIFKSTLEPGEKIYYDGKVISIEEYMQNILQFNPDTTGLELSNAGFLLESPIDVLTPANVKGNFTKRYINRINSAENYFIMASYFTELKRVFEEAQKETDITLRNNKFIEFINKKFKLQHYRNNTNNPILKRPVGSLYVNVSMSKNGKAVQLEFRGFDTKAKGTSSSFFANAIEAIDAATDEERRSGDLRRKASHIIPIELWESMNELFSVNHPAIKSIPKKAFTGVDMKDPIAVFQKVQEFKEKGLYRDKLQDYFNDIKVVTYRFGDFIQNSFVNTLQNIIDSKNSEIVENAMSVEFPELDGVITNYLDTPTGRVRIPIIHPLGSYNSPYYDNLSNYYINEKSIEGILEANEPFNIVNKALQAKLEKEVSEGPQNPPVETSATERKPRTPRAPLKVNKGKGGKSGGGVLSISAQTVDQTVIDKQISFIKSILPQLDIKEEDLATLLEYAQSDTNVFGYYADKVIHLDRNLRGSGVVYHEAFHGVFRHLMNSPERDRLRSIVKNDPKNAKFFTKEYKSEFAAKRKVLIDSQIEDLIAEEILADGYQQYTLKRDKYKGPFKYLFDLIQKIISFFRKHRREINKTFYRINNGYYTQAQINSNIYEDVAFKLVTGIPYYTNEDIARFQQSGTLDIDAPSLSSKNQKQLINRITREIINGFTKNGYNTRKSFDENFNLVRDRLLSIYDIENLISQDPTKEKEINKKYGALYATYNFILAAGTPKQQRTVYTGLLDDIEINKEFIEDPHPIDDEYTGIEELNEIKEAVRKNLRSFILRDVEREVQDQIDEMISMGVASEDIDETEIIDTLADEREAELPSTFESTLYGINVLTSMSAEFKKFFSTITFDKYDEELGIYVPSTIDGSWAFNAFLKMAADVSSDKILETINTKIENLKYDGKTEEYNRIRQVFDTFLETAGVDKNSFELIPGKGEKFYHEFINTFNVTSTNSVTVRRNKKGKLSFRVIDNLLESDSRTKADQMLNNMITTIRKNQKNTDKIKALSRKFGLDVDSADISDANKVINYYIQDLLRIDRTSISTSTQEGSYILDPYILKENASEFLERKTEILKEALDFAGFNFPKSFIRFSILAIDRFENKSDLFLYRDLPAYKDFESNFEKASKGYYISKSLIKAIRVRVLEPLAAGKSADVIYSQINNRITQGDTKVIRIQSGLRHALKYLVEEDPFDLQSMTIDAEKKPRYRYSTYTPFKLTTNSIKNNGLIKHFRSLEHFTEYLKSWYADHPFVKIMEGTNEDDKNKVRLLLSNMDVSTNMGIEMYDNRVNEGGKTFKNLDRQSQYLIDIVTFINNFEVFSFVDDNTYSQRMYKRSLGQLEGSRTNFLLNSPMERYVSSNSGKAIFTTESTTESVKSIMESVLPFVKQEYNRIAREVYKKENRLERHLDKEDGTITGDKNLILNFNARLKDGQVSTDPRLPNSDEKTGLRAFEFGYLGKMFASEYLTTEQVRKSNISNSEKTRLKQVVTTREKLRAKAINEGVIDFDKLPAGLKKDVQIAVAGHLNAELKKYLLKLQETGLVKINITVVENNVEKQIPADASTDLDTILLNLTETNLLPSSKSKFSGSNISSYYGSTGVGAYARMLSDKFYNDYVNSLTYTQLFDGDFNMSVPDVTQWTKRAKQYVASGPSGKKGFYRAAVVPEIEVFVSQSYPTLGEYDSLSEVREAVYEAFENGTLNLKRGHKNTDDVINTFSSKAVFDGQGVTSIMHQIISFEQIGKLDLELKNILIEAAYRPLTAKEILRLKEAKIPLNSKKTVHASTTTYLKHSEHLILRHDVSNYSRKYMNNEEVGSARLKEIYNEVFHLKNQLNDSYETLKSSDVLEVENIFKDASIIDAEARIRSLVEEAHTYFSPKTGKSALYDLLNEMEKNNIDYLSDTNASKRTTILPEFNPLDEEGIFYTPGLLNNVPLDMRYKFLQIETSRIKDKVRLSVQHKVLLAANRTYIKELLNNSLPEDEALNATKRIDDIMDDYLDTMSDIVANKIELFEKIMLDSSGNFDIVSLYNLVRESLIARDGDPNLIKLFEVKNGQPVYSAFLPKISETLNFYYYSAYTKNITEDEADGGKQFHVSSWGRKVLELTEDVPELNLSAGSIIRSELYEQFKDEYPISIKERNLKVTEEVDSDGVTTYWSEVIIPKPLFLSRKEEAFWLQNINKMFATRIPTEDKRSMIAFKVVDFIDSAYMNSVIVPHIVHVLAGSDFDIDTLYTQSFNYFIDKNGDPIKYGDSTTNEDRYKEYLHYIKSNPHIRDKISSKEMNISEDDIEMSDEFMSMARALLSDFEYNNITPDFIEDINLLRERVKEGVAKKEEVAERYETLKTNVTLEDPFMNSYTIMRDHPDYEGMTSAKRELRRIAKLEKELYQAESLIDKLKFIELLALSLRESNLPATLDEFLSTDAYKFVTPVLQNRNLQRKIDIISNEHIFQEMYIRETAESNLFKNILDVLGRSIDSIASEYDLHTTTAHIESKAASSSAAQGIGVAANMNKFLALNSIEGLTLSKSNTIWKLRLKSKDGTTIRDVSYDRFGSYDMTNLSDESKRAIAIVGEALGMFTDALKTPIPAALRLNDYNSAAVLAMFGLNIPPQFAVMVVQIKELREVIPVNPEDRFFLNQAINDKIVTMLFDRKNKTNVPKDTYNELLENGILNSNSEASRGRLNFIDDSYIIEYDEITTTIPNIDNPTLSSMGITVKNRAGQTLSEDVQKIILMSLFSKQASQQFEIYKVGKLMDYFKKLKPDPKRTADAVEVIQRLKSNKSLFANSDKMFKGKKIWNHFEKIAKMIIDKSDILYINETNGLSTFFNALSQPFIDRRAVSNKLLMHLALLRFKQIYQNREEDSLDPDSIEKRREALKMFEDVNYWFDLSRLVVDESNDYYSTITADIQSLRDRFPNNEFLKYLILNESNELAPYMTDVENDQGLQDNFNISFKHPQLVSKIKINNLEDPLSLSQAFEEMYYDKDPDVRNILERLILNEIVRTGLQKTSNTFLDKIDPEFGYKEVSDALNETVNFMKSIGLNTSKNAKTISEEFSKFFMGYYYPSTKSGSERNASSNELVIFDLTNIASLFTQTEAVKIKAPRSINMPEFNNAGNIKDKVSSALSYDQIKESLAKEVFGEFSYKNLYNTSAEPNRFNFFTPDLFRKRRQTQEEYEPGLTNESVQFDFSKLSTLTEEGKVQFVQRFGFEAIEDQDGHLQDVSFPMFYKTAYKSDSDRTTGERYILADANFKLESIDGVPVDQILMESLLQGKNQNVLLGKKAVYTYIELNQSNIYMNPIGKGYSFLRQLYMYSEGTFNVELEKEQLQKDGSNEICRVKPK